MLGLTMALALTCVVNSCPLLTQGKDDDSKPIIVSPTEPATISAKVTKRVGSANVLVISGVRSKTQYADFGIRVFLHPTKIKPTTNTIDSEYYVGSFSLSHEPERPTSYSLIVDLSKRLNSTQSQTVTFRLIPLREGQKIPNNAGISVQSIELQLGAK